ASWPKATPRTNRILWPNLQLSPTGQGLEQVEPSNWFSTLRKGESAYLLREGAAQRYTERFLTYDVELAYSGALRLSAGSGDGAYQVSNASSSPLHDLQLFRNQSDGWRVGTLKELKPGK